MTSFIRTVLIEVVGTVYLAAEVAGGAGSDSVGGTQAEWVRISRDVTSFIRTVLIEVVGTVYLAAEVAGGAGSDSVGGTQAEWVRISRCVNLPVGRQACLSADRPACWARFAEA